MDDFKLLIRQGRVVNKNPSVKLGREVDDLIKIIVAVFDLKGFTNFFNKIPINKNIVASSFVNGLLYWFYYRFKRYYKFEPVFSKFLGDGVLMIWEPGQQKISIQDIITLMNTCWDMVAASNRYEIEYLQEFCKKIGKRWNVKYPTRLRVGMSLGHAVKYIKRGKRSDYISESINIASRLVKFHEDIYFIAQSDLVFGKIPKKFRYVQKKIRLRGIGDLVVYIDKLDFQKAGAPKKFKEL